jgi:hypothetical protein
MDLSAVRKLPMKTFWMMSKNIDRFNAEEDLRRITVAVYSQSGDELVKFVQDLRKQVGEVIVLDQVAQMLNAKPDKEGLSELKNLGRIW